MSVYTYKKVYTDYIIMDLKPMQILKTIIGGSLIIWMISYLLGFYGLGGSASWPYLSYFFFILVSLGILDLDVPRVEFGGI